MPSRCICNGHQDPECKRHGSAARERARNHMRQVWAERPVEMAEQQRIARARQPRTKANRLEDMIRQPEAWKAQAACRGKDPALWYPDQHNHAKEAKAVCASCPVRTECLNYALAAGDDFGIWGGLGEHARRGLTPTEGIAS
jgi:WhiB family transcriptional regulator, redox-sensing transcriptional regulator